MLSGAWLARATWGLPSAIGARRVHITPYAAGSPRYRDRRFHNSDPSSSYVPGRGEKGQQNM
ncbi:MAG: hypothetical protein WBF80_07630, partial [Rhodococcus sp. (in: high G+C Gram-positive bacteria)]